MTHDELLQQVTNECNRLGLLWHHPPDSRRERAGWPDLVIAGPRGILFAEIKSEDGRVTQAQWRTGRQLLAWGHTWAEWRPADWLNGHVQGRLHQLARPPRPAA
jgi:hypothetical protein